MPKRDWLLKESTSGIGAQVCHRLKLQTSYETSIERSPATGGHLAAIEHSPMGPQRIVSADHKDYGLPGVRQAGVRDLQEQVEAIGAIYIAIIESPGA